MNNIIKIGVRRCLRSLVHPVRAVTSTNKSFFMEPAYTRTFGHMCSSSSIGNKNINVSSGLLGEPCTCGCRCVHSNGEKELVDFLKEEIVAEKKSQRKKTLPTDIDGFKVKTDGSEVELIKESGDEKITVNFNVNHTVDTESEPGVNPSSDQPDLGEMKSKPSFEIDIVRKGKTLSFTCSFVQPGEPSDDGYNDIFGIDEVTFFEQDSWSDKTYAVDGQVLDGYLYDLLMTILEEKGISNEFVQKLSDLATAHEHTSYIGLLENINNFIQEGEYQEMNAQSRDNVEAVPVNTT